MTVLDIGANIGAHTFSMAKLVGPKGMIIAFEPMKWAHDKLKTNIELNSFSNIVIEKIALSNKNDTGSAAFRTSWDKYDSSSDGISAEPSIVFQQLDNYVKIHNISSIDFIKLDVDGFEYKIIEGAIETLNKFKPTIIMELGNYTLESHGDSLESLVLLLGDMGYKFFKEEDISPLPTLEAINLEFPDPNTWTINSIVIHNSKLDLLNV